MSRENIMDITVEVDNPVDYDPTKPVLYVFVKLRGENARHFHITAVRNENTHMFAYSITQFYTNLAETEVDLSHEEMGDGWSAVQAGLAELTKFLGTYVVPMCTAVR